MFSTPPLLGRIPASPDLPPASSSLCALRSGASLDGVPPVNAHVSFDQAVPGSQLLKGCRLCCASFASCRLSTSLHSLFSSFAQDSRHFTFHYAFTVKNLPAGKKVRIWIPAAQSDAFQEVKIVSARGDLSLKKTRESKYGNEIYYAQAAKVKSGRTALRCGIRCGASRARSHSAGAWLT